MRQLASVILALPLLLIAAPVVGNDLSSEDPATGPILRVPPEPLPPSPWPPSPPPPPWPAGHELAQTVRRLSVGAPVSWGSLTLYPLHGPTRGDRDVISMEEGIRRGCLRVSDSGEVAWVRASNGCGTMVFLMAGDAISGGRQDRVVREDGLVPPWSGATTVPVYCVEQGRWDDDLSPFRPAPIAASPEMRRELSKGTSQDQVWRQVEEEARSAGASSPTSRYGAMMDAPDVKRRVAEAQEALCRPIRRQSNIVGVVIARGGTILGADIFASSRLMDEALPKLVASHAMGGWSECNRCGPRPGQVEDFLRSFEGSSVTGSLGTFGAGHRYGVQSSMGSGTVLSHDGAIVHAALFR